MWNEKTLLRALQTGKETVGQNSSSLRQQVFAWTPRGDWELNFILPNELSARLRLLGSLKNWLHYKQASAILVLRHIETPRGVMAVGLKRNGFDVQCEAIVDWCKIYSDRLEFDGPEWLSRDDIEDEVLALLPTRELVINPVAMETLAATSIAGAGVAIQAISMD